MYFKTALITLIFFFNTLMGTGFRIGTPIYTPDGLMPIEKVAPGTFVYCSDSDTISLQKVTHKKFTIEKDCLTLVFDNQEKIVVSQKQEFYNPIERIWKKVHDLTINDILLRADNSYATIEKIIHVPQKTLLLDLSVENCHNYFVSSQALLVHNFEPVSFGIFFTILIGSGGVEVSSIGAAIYVAGIALGIKGWMNNKSPREQLSDNDVQLSHPDYPRCYYQAAASKTNGFSIEPILKAAPPCYKTKKDTTSADNAQNAAQEEAAALRTTKQVEPPTVGAGCGELKPEEFPIHTGGHIKPEQPTRIPGCSQQKLPPAVIHTGDTNPPVIQGPLILYAEGSDNKTEQRNRSTECNLAKEIVIASNNAKHAQAFSEKNIVVHMSKETEKDRLTQAGAPGKPTAEDGFIPPKGWDEKKIRHPKTGQYGYPDKHGDVWVPTGPAGDPLAHGGPHWDVVDKDGKRSRNVMPGGHERGKQNKSRTISD